MTLVHYKKYNFKVGLQLLTATTPSFFGGQVRKTNRTYSISFMINGLLLICLSFKSIMQKIDLEIKQQSLHQRHGSPG